MKSAVLALLMLVSPSFAVAEPMRNANTYPVNMRGGPGVGFAVLDQLDPGEVAERGRCDLRGLWCLMSTDQKVGWINTSILRTTQAEVVPGTDQA
ncbi:MAG: SH3 domain-containing protein, partial [Jannaschia helgolandensis]